MKRCKNSIKPIRIKRIHAYRSDSDFDYLSNDPIMHFLLTFHLSLYIMLTDGSCVEHINQKLVKSHQSEKLVIEIKASVSTIGSDEFF